MKGVPLLFLSKVNEWGTFSVKKWYMKGKGLDLREEPPHIQSCLRTSLPLPGMHNNLNLIVLPPWFYREGWSATICQIGHHCLINGILLLFLLEFWLLLKYIFIITINTFLFTLVAHNKRYIFVGNKTCFTLPLNWRHIISFTVGELRLWSI